MVPSFSLRRWLARLRDQLPGRRTRAGKRGLRPPPPKERSPRSILLELVPLGDRTSFSDIGLGGLLFAASGGLAVGALLRTAWVSSPGDAGLAEAALSRVGTGQTGWSPDGQDWVAMPTGEVAETSGYVPLALVSGSGVLPEGVERPTPRREAPELVSPFVGAGEVPDDLGGAGFGKLDPWAGGAQVLGHGFVSPGLDFGSAVPTGLAGGAGVMAALGPGGPADGQADIAPFFMEPGADGGLSGAALSSVASSGTTAPAGTAGPTNAGFARTDQLGLALAALAGTVQPPVSASPVDFGLSGMPQAPAVPSQQAVAQALADAPVGFEPNVGQVSDARQQFVARGPNYAFFLASDTATLVLQPSSPVPAAPSPTSGANDFPAPLATPLPPTQVQMQFVGANPDARAAGLAPLSSTTNYFLGSDPRLWHADVPTFSQVRLHEVYPGIDLVYHGASTGPLEYDWVVAPGSDPGRVRVAFSGAQDLHLDAQGNLVLDTAAGAIEQHAPVLYQDQGGVRQLVAGRFVMNDDQSVSVAVGAYDTTRPLVIDPVLSYSTYLGGSGSDLGKAIAVDPSSNVYVAGLTSSLNFPTLNPFQATNGGGLDAFVTKLDAQGRIVYSTYLGGSGSEEAAGIAVDSSGSAYVTGLTQSANFPTTAGVPDVAGRHAECLRHQADPGGQRPVLLHLPGRQRLGPGLRYRGR